MAETEKILTHIATIHDLDDTVTRSGIDGMPATIGTEGWTVRMAARCIVVEPETGRIGLQHLDSEGVNKIPGGGLQYTTENIDATDSENFEQGVMREIGEEIGVSADDITLHALGIVMEYRKNWHMVQMSYCYVGTLLPGVVPGEPKEDGSHLVWADSSLEALGLVRDYPLDTYDKEFMMLRDVSILEYYNASQASE